MSKWLIWAVCFLAGSVLGMLSNDGPANWLNITLHYSSGLIIGLGCGYVASAQLGESKEGG